MDVLLWTAWTGICATLVLDAWSLVRRVLFGVPAPDYGLVGRWLAHMLDGRFRHPSIRNAPAIPHERLLGWVAHYATGIAFAALLPALWGTAWYRAPTPAACLVVGIGSVLAPFLLMQPGMGAGIAASRTPDPSAARVNSLLNHAVFGFGLYLAALAAHTCQGVL